MTSPVHHAELARQVRSLRPLALILAGGDADDAVQDALVSALAQGTPPRSLGPWLRQVLRNCVRTRARAHERRRRRERDCARHR